MTTRQAEGQSHVRSHRIQITTRRNYDPSIRNNKRTVKLSELFYCAAEVWISDLSRLLGVSGKWIENQRTRARQHCISVAKREKRSDTATLATFARYLNGQLDRRFEILLVAPAHLCTNPFEHTYVSSV